MARAGQGFLRRAEPTPTAPPEPVGSDALPVPVPAEETYFEIDSVDVWLIGSGLTVVESSAQALLKSKGLGRAGKQVSS